LAEAASAISGVPIGSGMTAYVLPAGTATSSTVVSGGTESVYSGGIAIGAVVGSGGHETVRSGGSASGASVASGGYESVMHGGTATGTTVSGGGTAFVYSAGSATAFVLSNGGVETIETGGSATLTTVEPGGSIDLPALAYSGGQPTISGDLLTVNEGAGVYQQLLTGDYTGMTFQAMADAAYAGAGTLVTLQCFCRGTAILTEHGPLPIEFLRVGDLVPTMVNGELEPVIWIGHRQVDCASQRDPRLVWPVRISAGAFGPGIPGRDLFLSPDHAVFVNNVLVPVKLLINGTSIVQIQRGRVSYFHVELPRHAVILAEGLTVESYFDTGDRTNFDDSGTIRLFPDFASRLAPEIAMLWEMRGAARLVMTGAGLKGARRAVMRRAPRRRFGSVRPSSQAS
jgi:autotransporter passenger strand-loop-strand repeat protein